MTRIDSVAGPGLPFADAQREGKRFIVRAEEMLTAFVELERAVHEFAVSLLS